MDDAATTPTGPPVDADADGLNDSYERRIGTDPTVVDTDGDLLEERWEVQERAPTFTLAGGNDQHLSDPVARKLSENGFAHSKRFDEQFCGS